MVPIRYFATARGALLAVVVLISAWLPTTAPVEAQTGTATTPPVTGSATATIIPDSLTPDATNPATLTLTPTPAASAATPSQVPGATQTVSPSDPAPNQTASPSPPPAITPTPSASEEAMEPPPGSIRINEIAWSGTVAAAQDEWLELYNPGPTTVSIDGWQLTDGGDLDVALAGAIAPHSYFLLERTDDTTINSLSADQIYTGSLRNSGETLYLYSSGGSLIDTANSSGGSWPAGDAINRASMQRQGGQDTPTNWFTFQGAGSALDADGNPIAGTPRGANTQPLPTASPSLTVAASLTPTPPAPQEGSIWINEIAWAGTRASASDEWIELYNPGPQALDLDGWRLIDGGDIDVALSGVLGAGDYYLLERSDDTTIRDLAANVVYSGSLRNSGESLQLMDNLGQLIDSANLDGGDWPAGSAASRYSMERRGATDSRSNWGTFTGYGHLGHDAEGSSIGGTPLGKNSVLIPTPTPTWIPGSVVINEVLIRPHYDWEGTGGVTTADEFIELYNRGPGDVWLRGWLLDDISGSGSKPWALPGVTISDHGHAVFFRSQTHIALNDSGDSVRLLAPDGRMIDKLHYKPVRAYNLSYGRLPNGSNSLAYGLWPTPGEANVLFVEPEPLPESPLKPRPAFLCPEGGLPRSLLPRADRFPWQLRLLHQLGLGFCEGSR